VLQKIEEEQEQLQYPTVEEYRAATLKVIQDMLKWREEMQKVYKEQTGHKAKMNILSQGKSYFVQIYSEGTLKKFRENPFLLGFEDRDVHNDMLMKIRACELFLL
jgi:hypothetical protein